MTTSALSGRNAYAGRTGRHHLSANGRNQLSAHIARQKGKQKEHTYLYWEYPDPRIGNKAIRMGKWKGIITDIRKGNTQMQLYNLETDIREEHDVAAQHPDIVKRFERLMKEARNGPDF